MDKQFDDLLKIYKEYIGIFNNWESTKKAEVDAANYNLLINIFHNFTDLLIWNNVIEKDGIKHYKVIKTGEKI